MRKLIAVALCVTAAAVALPASSASAAVTVRLTNAGFSRGIVTIKHGELVRFRIRGSRRHGVYARHVPRGAKHFRSKTRRRLTFRVRLRRRGTYHVVCTKHGSNEEMYIRVR